MTTDSARMAVGTMVFLALGPVVWALHFTLVYASQSTMCALGVGVTADGGSSIVTATSTAIVLVMAGFLSVSMARAHRVLMWLGGSRSGQGAGGEFAVAVMRILSALSLVAMSYTVVGVVLLPACA